MLLAVDDIYNKNQELKYRMIPIFIPDAMSRHRQNGQYVDYVIRNI